MEDSIGKLTTEFQAHAKADAAYQKLDGEEKVKTNDRLEAIEKQLQNLATKDDWAELKGLLNTVRVTSGIFNFTFENAAKIGSFLILLGGFYIFIKYGIYQFFLFLTKISGF